VRLLPSSPPTKKKKSNIDNTNPEAKHILDTYQVYVLPTNNPDGLNYVWTVDDYWRKNRSKREEIAGVFFF